MKNKILPIFFLASFLISGCLSANAVNTDFGSRFISSFYSPSSLNGDNLQKEMKTRKIQVVDSVEARSLMSNKAMNINGYITEKRDELYEKLASLEKARGEYKRSLEHIYKLDGYSSQPKNKNKNEINLIMDYLPGLLDRVPESVVLPYCKEEDVEKARNSAMPTIELKKLVSKFKETVLKNSKKGDFSSGFVQRALIWESTEIRGKLNAVDKEIKRTQIVILNLMNQRVRVSKNFDSAEWSKLMGETPIPTKTVEVPVPDFNGLTYDQMVNKYFNTPDLRKALNENFTVEGRFDGQNLDRISVFPVESSFIGYEEGVGKSYSQVVLMSEIGTVLPYTIHCSEDRWPFYYNSDYGLGLGIDKINAFWPSQTAPRDGIIISFFAPAGSASDFYTFVLNGDKWVNEPPYDPEYLSYNECQEILKNIENNSTFNAIAVSEVFDDEKEALTDIKIFPVSKKDFISNIELNEVDNIHFKSNKDVEDLKIPAKEYLGYQIEKDFWGKNNDALIIYRKEETDNNQNQTVCDVYKLIMFEDYDGYYINGTEYDQSTAWYKYAEGIYDPEIEKFRLHPIDD